MVERIAVIDIFFITTLTMTEYVVYNLSLRWFPFTFSSVSISAMQLNCLQISHINKLLKQF